MHDDLKELIATLQSHNVEFLVVGAHALAFYGRPRFTEDLDLFLRRSAANESALIEALQAFGLPIRPEAITRLMTRDRQMVVLGNEPNAVDLLTFLDGVDFEASWEHRVTGELAGIPVYFISREDYIKTKRATGRAKDLRDIEILEGR
jgi:hypothetical protein